MPHCLLPTPQTSISTLPPHAPRHQECKVNDFVDDPDIPGPGFYGNPDPDPMGRSGPAYTFRPRHRDRNPDDAPGPGEYAAPTSPQGPAYTMRGRTASPGRSPRGDSPGPGAYSPRSGPEGPAFTMAPRVREAAGEDTPAPGEYGTLDRWAGGEGVVRVLIARSYAHNLRKGVAALGV